MSMFSIRALPVSTPVAPAKRSIVSAAVRTTQIEQPAPFKPGSEVALSQALFQVDNTGALHAATMTASVRNFTLENVVLDTDSLMLFQDRALIAETDYFAPPQANRSANDPGVPPPGDDDSDIIFAAILPHRGYQHWLTHCLPAIDWCMRQQGDRPVRLLLPRLSPGQEELLQLLGYGRVPRLIPEPHARYRLKRVHFSEFLIGVHSRAVSLSLHDTIQRILAAVPPSSATQTMLYVPGTHYYYGALSNEAEVIQVLRGAGVRIVEPTLPAIERINLFRNAQVVIGPLGQGLCDVAFCRPGTLLWEWMPRHHLNPAFNRLAQAAGVDYLGDVFPVTPGPVAVSEWQVDISVVQERLKQINDRLMRLAGRAAAPPQQLPLPADAVARAEPVPAPRFEGLGDGPTVRLDLLDPAGLLQVARFDGVAELQLPKLVSALEQGFEGLGSPGSVTVSTETVGGRRELVASDSIYGLRYATGIAEGAAAPDTVATDAGQRLGFLGRKLLDDMLSGEKIWVWHSAVTTQAVQLEPLLRVLRRLGQNVLLWVTTTGPGIEAGTIEPLAKDFIRGYVPSHHGSAAGLDPASLQNMLVKADRWLTAQSSITDDVPLGPFAPLALPPEANAEAPALAQAEAEMLTDTVPEPQVLPELEDQREPVLASGDYIQVMLMPGKSAEFLPVVSAAAEAEPAEALAEAELDQPNRPPSAMDYLTRNAAGRSSAAPLPPPARRSILGRFFGRS